MTTSNYQFHKAILALADGSVFHGIGIGAVETVAHSCGELVFNTSMTGYQEIITDPSYCEQIIMFTVPHIGNVGVNSKDSETNQSAKIWSKGIVIKSLAKNASNWRCEQDLNSYLKDNNLIGIAEVDTRAITTLLRDHGALKSCIYILNDNSDLSVAIKKAIELAKQSSDLQGLDLAKKVSVLKSYSWEHRTYQINKPLAVEDSKSDKRHHIVVYDFGVKAQILRLLKDRKFDVTVVPAETSAQEVLALKPNGILLSNGPGDPAACSYAIENTKTFIKNKIPIFGICLGFQILGLALGARTLKMKFGHHGGNHPVKDLNSGQVLITSQNHGFMVSEESIPNEVAITHKSLFDGTVQGLAHKTLPILGFQGHPEASPGPNDIEYLFNRFKGLVEQSSEIAVSNKNNSVTVE